MAEPETLEELCEVVAAASRVRVLGQGHSFVPICHVSDEDGTMISLSKMCAVLDLDEENMTVTVEGGINYSQLTGYLSSDERPFALANVQSHPSFTVAGTLATASHGSSAIDPETGRAWLGGQASLARSCLMVLADGSTRRFNKGDPEWGAIVVNLGCMGVMAEITLDLVPDHDWELTMYRNIPPQHLIDHWREVAETCGSPGQVSQIQCLGTWWGPHASMAVACRKLVPAYSPQITADDCEPSFRGEGNLAMGSEGFYRTRTHRAHQLFGTDERQMQELQFEFFVPLEHAEAAMAATWEVSKDWHLPCSTDPEGKPFANYTDIRVIRGDEHWLSPTTSHHGGDTIAMAMGLNKNARGEVLVSALKDLEAALLPFQMRPHWGKLSTYTHEDYKRIYGSKLDEFCRVANELDPSGKMRNDWAEEKLFGTLEPRRAWWLEDYVETDATAP
jgi:xylitol oxidase